MTSPGTSAVTWSFPTEIRFGAGRIAELADACVAAGMRRPLLVTDPALAALPVARRALDVLGDGGLDVHVFTGVHANPTGRDVAAGVAAFRRHGADGVVAFGGGASLDVGKLVAFQQAQRRPLLDFADRGDNWRRAATTGLAPVVAVPTTAGTGSEVGRAGVIVDEATCAKTIIFHPRLLPVTVIADPALTVGLPPSVTAATGMDALAHCLEAYCASGFHPLCDGIAVEGMRLIHANLARAFGDGDDLDARGAMLVAASMGAVAFQKGLGAMHALAHPIGAAHDTHHGLTNAVLMPYVLVFNRAAIEARIERLAAWLALPAPGFDGFLGFVLALRRELGIPATLAALGVRDPDVARLAAAAVADPSAAGNPVPLTRDAAGALIEGALDGRLDAPAG